MNKYCLALKEIFDTFEYFAFKVAVTSGFIWLVWYIIAHHLTKMV
jgi:hypothetical protein